MNLINRTVISMEKFIEDHKVAIAVSITTAICLKLNTVAMRGHDNFLRERGLYYEFYNHQN